MERIAVLPKDLQKGIPTQLHMILGDTLVVESCTMTRQFTGKMFLQRYLIVAVLKGSFCYTARGSNFIITENQCGLIERGLSVEYAKKGDDVHGACHLINFFLNDAVLTRFFTGSRFDPKKRELSQEAVDCDDRLQAYLKSILAYLHHPSELPDGFVEAKQKELLYLLQTLNSGFLGALSLEGSAKISLRQAVMDNLSHPFSLSDLSYWTGRSVSGLKREFSAEFGMPPMRWITQARLQKARVLLDRSETSVLEICLLCGFRNVSHFSRKFKDYFGYPPSQIRARTAVATRV